MEQHFCLQGRKMAVDMWHVPTYGWTAARWRAQLQILKVEMWLELFSQPSHPALPYQPPLPPRPCYTPSIRFCSVGTSKGQRHLTSGRCPLTLHAVGDLSSSCPPSQHASHLPSLHMCAYICIYLHCIVWHTKDSPASHLPSLTNSLVHPRTKSTANWHGPSQKGWEGHLVSSIFPRGHLFKGFSGFGANFWGLRKGKKTSGDSQSNSEWSNCSEHQWQALGTTPNWLRMGKGKDIWATFISSSEKTASGRRESLTGCSHLTATSESAEISPTALLLSFSNLKDLVRTDSELQSGWTSPSGQWYQEERDRQRWWFHNSTQMCPDARTVTQQTSGPHVLRTTNSWLIMTSMLPPISDSRTQSPGARTLSKVLWANREVFAHRISSHLPCQNFHWLRGSS